MIQHCNLQRMLAFFAVVMVLAFTGGCSKNGSTANGEVLAKVNSYKVLLSEVDKAYNVQVAGAPQKPTAAEEEALRLQVLNQIIYRQLLLQRAEKLGVAATEDEVQSKFRQAKAPYTGEEFQKRLKDGGLNEEDYKLDLRRSLTVEKLLNKEVSSKVSIADADITEYYDQNKAQFNLNESQYYFARIYLNSLANAPSGDVAVKAPNDAQAHQTIRTIHNRLDSGEDFGTLAAKYSEDTDTARSGGSMQPMPESQIVKADPLIRDAVQKLKPGQYTDVLPVTNPQTRQPTGYQIIKLVGKEAAGQRELNDPAVQQFIRNKLRTQKEKTLRAAFDEVVRESAEIHNYFAERILKESVAQK